MKAVGRKVNAYAGVQYLIYNSLPHPAKNNVMENSNQNENFWNPPEHNLGIVIPGTTYKVNWEYKGDKKIQSVHTSCGCTLVEPPKGNKIDVQFTPKQKPTHITGEQRLEKRIKVVFKDGEFEHLYIRGIVQ